MNPKSDGRNSFKPPSRRKARNASPLGKAIDSVLKGITSGGERAVYWKTLAALALAFLALAAAMGIVAQRGSQTSVFPMHVVVTTGVIGFNVTPMLEFGSMPGGGSGRKTMTIVNDLGMDKVIYLRASGEIGPWSSVSQNSFHLKPGESRNVSIYVTVPMRTPPGDYYGKFEVTYAGVKSD